MSAERPLDDALSSRAVDADADTAVSDMAEQIRQAAQNKTPLTIVGGDTKAFYGRQIAGTPFDVSGYAGIVSYEPTELVITAKCGTTLLEIEQHLEREGQMLGFEPPHCGPRSTVGGAVASGLSGPARPYRGALRDFVLGVDMINGRGQVLRFGGQVMKNVAGFDVSRLMAGSLGTLGVITQASLRVLPSPQHEASLVWDFSKTEAHAQMLRLAREPWPITAMAFDGTQLRVRVSGSKVAVADAIDRINPHSNQYGDDYWQRLRDFELPFFSNPDESLWRLSLPPAAPDIDADGQWLWDWGGAQRWLSSATDGKDLSRHCEAHGGHVLCFQDRTGLGTADAFTQPAPALRAVLARLNQAFDPHGVFNSGRHYAWM